MAERALSPGVHRKVLELQRNEITEYEVYLHLAARAGGQNAELLRRIARDERRHYEQWASYTGQRPKASWLRVHGYRLMARVLGFTFTLKLMEKAEQRAQAGYEEVMREVPAAEAILKEENEHELLLLGMLDEQRLRYVGSVVLGLSDALVELAGALAGLTFALRQTRLVALAALVTGLAASLSMAASEYLSKKSEHGTEAGVGQRPVTAALYTGTAYVLTVVVMVAPYFLLGNALIALAASLGVGVAIVLLFTAFLAVVQDRPFGRTFLEMAGLTLAVAALSFLIGTVARALIGVDID